MVITFARNYFEYFKQKIIVLRREKCFFRYTKIEFVGHILSKEGNRPIPALVEKIKQEETVGRQRIKVVLGFSQLL